MRKRTARRAVPTIDVIVPRPSLSEYRRRRTRTRLEEVRRRGRRTRTIPELIHYPATIDDESLAGVEIAARAGKKCHRVGQVFHRATPLERLAFENETGISLGIWMNLLRVGREGPGRDGVDREVLRPNLPGEPTGE